MNIERLLDKIIEAMDSTFSYYRESARYRSAHGFGAYFDLRAGLSAEKENLYHKYNRDYEDNSALSAIFEVLDFNSDQIARAYVAARALRKWYNRTEWQFCPGYELKDALEKFVIYG